MPGTLVIPNTFATQSGNVPVSQLDTDLTTIATYINAREITVGLIGSRPSAGTSGRYYFATDVGGGTLYEDNGSAWVTLTPGIIGGTPVTLTSAATVTVDATLGTYFTLTAAQSFTLGNPTGALNGQKLMFRLLQDNVGGRVLTLDTKYRLGTDLNVVTLSTTANKTDYLGVVYDSTADKFDVIAFMRGY